MGSADFCDIPEFYAEDFPIARKAYACCECSAPIDPGEKHLAARLKWDGEFEAYRQHMLCRELCMLMQQDDDCCGFGEMFLVWSEAEWDRDWNKRDAPYREGRRLMARIRRRERRSTAGRA